MICVEIIKNDAILPDMSETVLSIITICKNTPFITDTCDSVMSQTNQNFEWIIIDGASNDDTLQKLEPYTHRANVFISEPDNGIYAAQNKGIRNSNGKYLMFLNGGDLLYAPDTIDKAMDYLTRGTECVFYGDSYRLFEAPEKCFVKTYPDVITKDFFMTNTLGHQSCFIHRNLFEKHGPYREDFKIVSDKEKWLAFVSKGVEFEHIPFPCSRFRMNGVSSHKNDELKAEKIRLLTQYFPETVLRNSKSQHLQELFAVN